MLLGYVKLATAIPSVQIANPKQNAQQIIGLLKKADEAKAHLVLFPELCITGYTCADLFLQPFLLLQALEALDQVVRFSRFSKIVAVVGCPLQIGSQLFNCAVVISNGKILGVVPKQYMPNYGEFYEARWFQSASCLQQSEISLFGASVPVGVDLLFQAPGLTFGVEVCEDLWVPVPPSSYQAMAGAQLLLNLSASNEMVGKHNYLLGLVEGQSARLQAVYAYCSAGVGESSTDLVFAGNGLIAENGTMLAKASRFSREEQLTCAWADITKIDALRNKSTTFAQHKSLPQFRRVEVELRSDICAADIDRTYNPTPFIPNDPRSVQERCEEIFNIQVWGLAQRMKASYSRKAVVGISGGLDSTLALLVTARTFDFLGMPRKDIIGVTMPGFGTTNRTYTNAIELMKALGVEIREISIKDACIQHFKDINLPDTDRSVTYENSQARERTQILMDIANRDGGLVVGTGDLSELALGWATYNGDQMSMYGVNASVPKTLVRYLVEYVANDNKDPQATPYLMDIVDTPISPELLPPDEQGNIAQKTEDNVGPYILHDFFIYHFMRFGYSPERLFFMANKAFAGMFEPNVIKKWLNTMLRRFFSQQFKRSAMPDGPKVGSVSLSPRGDWRMPSDAPSALWLSQIEKL